MAKYGTQEAEGTPLSQQTFGEQRSKAVHAPLPTATYVSGVGSLGIDIEGYAKGDKMAQEYRLNENADARSEETLGLAKEQFGLNKEYLDIAQQELGIKLEDHAVDMEKFGWEKDARIKSQMLDAGMQKAAGVGGYEAVIEYLKTADPNKAIAFHAEKLKLDNSILSNDTMKSIAQNDKSKAMVESYGVLGKMGQALLKSPEKDRENLFKTMQPLLKQVLGAGAPKSLEEAVPVFMLSVAQATPENQLFKSEADATKMQSAVGKLDADINAKLKSGSTPDNDTGLKEMLAARNAYTQRNEQALLNKAAIELKMEATKQQTASSKLTNTEKMQKVLDGTSKDFLGYMKDYTGVSGAFKVLEQDPENASAQGTVSTMMASAIQSGVLTEPDWERVSRSNAGFKKILENYGASWASGKNVLLAPDEVANLKQVFDEVTKSKVAAQKYREDQFKSTKLEGWGDILDPSKITYPSSIYDKMSQEGKYSRIIKQYGLEQYPVEIQQQAAEAIDQGVDPIAIKQYMDKQNGKQ